MWSWEDKIENKLTQLFQTVIALVICVVKRSLAYTWDNDKSKVTRHCQEMMCKTCQQKLGCHPSFLDWGFIYLKIVLNLWNWVVCPIPVVATYHIFSSLTGKCRWENTIYVRNNIQCNECLLLFLSQALEA